jgi:hypothetical protein
MPNPALTRPGALSDGVFTAWLQLPVARRMRDRVRPMPASGVRFAFYGRISTKRFQDPVSSRAGQPQAVGDHRGAATA